MHLLYEIAQREGTEKIVLGNLVIGGCSLATHAYNIMAKEPAYSFLRNENGEWKTTKECTMLYGVEYEDWDIITIQQASVHSGKAETYDNSIQLITTFLNANKRNPNAKILWNMTWAYAQSPISDSFKYYENDQMTMYRCIVGAVQEKILPDGTFAGVLPVGTAIQNARTSCLGDTMNRDAAHLGDLGRVIAAYTWYCSLAGKELDQIALDAVPDKLTVNYSESGDMPLSKTEKQVIAEAVKNALENPFEVTQSQYKDISDS